ncbi:MAG: T9SS type A sorting domain-containing protein [Bacteroidota bacterium]
MVASHCYAQFNLCPNPSFENFSSCPQFGGDINKAIDWSSYSISPDYYNSCANFSAPFFGVPANWIGYQSAFDGNGYAGLATYDGTISLSNREFIGIQLIQTLIPGIRYYVSAYISRADSFPYTCASNKFGFRFSTVAYSVSNPCPVDNFSHVHSDSIITNSIDWTCISGSFVPDSVYQFLIIGNFYDDSHTDTLNCHQTGACYYIDEVNVSTDSLLSCGYWTGIRENDIQLKQVNIFPNPVSDKIYLTIKARKIIYNIIDNMGETIKSGTLNNESSEIGVSSIKNGIYLLLINQKFYSKISIIH